MRDYSKWAAGKAHPAKTSKANPKGHLVGISFDLGSKMTFGKRDRVYVIFKNQAGRFVGRFLIGKRRRAPWTGASFQETGDDNEG